MSADLKIHGCRKKDSYFRVMKEIYDVCKKHGVSQPKEVQEYFFNKSDKDFDFNSLDFFWVDLFPKSRESPIQVFREHDLDRNEYKCISINLEKIPKGISEIKIQIKS